MAETVKEFDAVVIGSGPGGEGASMQITKGGKNVGVVERYNKLGGGVYALGNDSQQGFAFGHLPDDGSEQQPFVPRDGNFDSTRISGTPPQREIGD